MKRLLYVMMILITGCSGGGGSYEFYQSGMKEFASRKLDKAEKLFLAALEKDETLLNAGIMLSKIYYYSGNYKSAIEYADYVLDYDPDHVTAMYWKARSLVMVSPVQTSKAIELLKTILEKDSHYISARLLLGILHEKNKDYESAVYQYVSVIEEEDEIISARCNLAMLYMRMGLKEKSAKELDIAGKISECSGKGSERIKVIRKEIGD